jgi:hypothetical protein
MTLALLQQAVMANKTATHRTISIDYCLGQFENYTSIVPMAGLHYPLYAIKSSQKLPH